MEITSTQSELQSELEKLYKARFSGNEDYRNYVWRLLVQNFFGEWIPENGSVLDLGCGYCEFIRNVSAQEKFGMDLNPSVREILPAGVTLLEQDCSSVWPLEDESLDVVFTSNFFEHLPTKLALQRTLAQTHRCLKPGGRLIAIGPNIKHLHGRYWDFFDHHLPLTEAALSEVLSTLGFATERSIAKFLPYTMSMKAARPPGWAIKLYLKLPMAWYLFGKQFLVVARK